MVSWSRLTKAQARKRLNEAQRKLLAVYMAQQYATNAGDANRINAITAGDMIAIEKMFRKFQQRLK